MEHLRYNLLDQRRQDLLKTKRQRRYINDLLRDAYDDAERDANGERFSVSLHVSDLQPLTPQNERYLRDGQANADFQKLFGIIAARAELSIDHLDDDYIISLWRDGKRAQS